MYNTLSEITQLWDKVLEKIESKINDDVIFNSFFEHSYIYSIKGNLIIVVVNSALAVQLMKSKYYPIVSEALSDVAESEFDIDFVTSESIDQVDKEQSQPKKVNYFANVSLNPNLTFDNFIVGPFNRESSQAALLIARNPGKMFNPLFIHSQSGLGKTHLLNAIGNYIKNDRGPDTKVLYISANNFVEEYIKYVRGDKESQSLKDFICGFDVLLLDDVQLLANKVNTQEMFFHIYTDLINRGKQIVITSDRNPNELKDLQDRLVTRFNQGLVVNIKDPDQSTCVAILENKIEASGLDITKFDDQVLQFFANKFSKNVRELEGALNRLIFHIVNIQQTDNITMEIAAEAVSQLIGGKSLTQQLNEQKIINIVADYYNIQSSQLTGSGRTAQIALARHIAIYLIRQNLDIPLTKIGQTFGGKDHTTIMHAIQHVDKELKNSEQLKQVISELQKRIKK